MTLSVAFALGSGFGFIVALGLVFSHPEFGVKEATDLNWVYDYLAAPCYPGTIVSPVVGAKRLDTLCTLIVLHIDECNGGDPGFVIPVIRRVRELAREWYGIEFEEMQTIDRDYIVYMRDTLAMTPRGR